MDFNIKSPLSNFTEIELIEKINTDLIIDAYKKVFKIDVERFFKGVSEILLYKDIKTDYRFYLPKIETDSSFYEQLQSFDWYYMSWKWEFDQAIKYIKPGSDVLEIGCGKGAFLKGLKKMGHNVVGLEFNQESVKRLNNIGINVYPDTIEDYSITNREKFDVVVSFQVLEHVFDCGEFLNSAISVLKPKGLLIICVPNNDSFISKAKFSILNMPPHHSGLWSEKSLVSVSNLFDLVYEKTEFEPLQKYHYGWYLDTVLKNRFGDGFIIKAFVSVILRSRLYKMMFLFSKKIMGHSIMAVYSKK